MPRKRRPACGPMSSGKLFRRIHVRTKVILHPIISPKPVCETTNCSAPSSRRRAANVPKPGSTRLLRTKPQAAWRPCPPPAGCSSILGGRLGAKDILVRVHQRSLGDCRSHEQTNATGKEASHYHQGADNQEPKHQPPVLGDDLAAQFHRRPEIDLLIHHQWQDKY